MSKGKSHTGCKICCITSLIVILLIVAVIAVSLFVITPNMINIGDTKIEQLNNKSLNELGFGDLTLFKIIKELVSMKNVKESDVVKNGYDSTEESSNTETNFANVDGYDKDTFDYTSLATTDGMLKYDNQYLLSYKDTTIAYIFNEIVSSASSDAADSTDADLQKAADLKLNIKELTLTKTTDGDFYMRIVASFDTAPISEQLGESGSSILPENIYLVSNIKTSVDSTGKLVFSDGTIGINGDTNTPTGKAILNMVNEVYSLEEMNNTLCNEISTIMWNIGQIGTATADSNNVVTGDISLGVVGLYDGKITVITHTK